MRNRICLFLVLFLLLTLTACGGGTQSSVPGEASHSSGGSSVSPAASLSSPPAHGPLPGEAEDHEPPAQDAPAGESSPTGAASGNTAEAARPGSENAGASQEDGRPSETPPAAGGSHTSPGESAPPAAAPGAPAEEPETPAPEEEPLQSETSEEEAAMNQNTFYVSVGGTTFAAAFAENTGAQALKELLAQGPVTIAMSDYGGFEKVGSLGQSLPTSNSQTTTQSGDIVLYQGSQIVIFYGSNSWSYTRLGKINDLTGWEEALGGGDVSVTFSLTNG